MAKPALISTRLEEAERAALERVARADDRTVSALVRKIIVEWLSKNGYLKGGPTGRGKDRRKP
jgi:hypothetical protein